MTTRVVLADDEPLGRQRLVRLLEELPGVEVVAACADGDEAVAAIRDLRPDVVLLDIQMPGLDGFGVVAALGSARPAVVFVTAHDRYALRAFEVHAVDYLLKPVDPERLRAVMRRAAAAAPGGAPEDAAHRLLVLLEELAARDRPPGAERLVVRSAERTLFVRAESIDWVEADGKLVRLHAGKAVHVMRETMAELERRLDPRRFVRISRSVIVNLDAVREIQPWFQGDYVLILADGTRVTSTRGYRDTMRRLLGRSA